MSRPPFQKCRALLEPNPRGHPRLRLERGRLSKCKKLPPEQAPTRKCGDPAGPSVAHGASQGQKGVLPSPRGMLGQYSRSPGGAETLRPGPGAGHAERKGPGGRAPGTARGTDGARACARACAPPPGRGSPAETSPRGPLRRSVSSPQDLGRGYSSSVFGRGDPFPPATPINEPH